MGVKLLVAFPFPRQWWRGWLIPRAGDPPSYKSILAQPAGTSLFFLFTSSRLSGKRPFQTSQVTEKAEVGGIPPV